MRFFGRSSGGFFSFDQLLDSTLYSFRTLAQRTDPMHSYNWRTHNTPVSGHMQMENESENEADVLTFLMNVFDWAPTPSNSDVTSSYK